MTRMTRFLTFSLMLVGLAAAPIACQNTPRCRDGANRGRAVRMGHHGRAPMVKKAVAVLRPTRGHDAWGVVTFEQLDGGKVKVVADVTGLAPGSIHGFHIHQYGDLREEDGTSAGGHYNPRDHDHALPPDRPRHAGDLGNLHADDQGTAHLTITVANISVAGKRDPILGRGVIVHAKPDDGGQPTGHAGARIAMGVIGAANPEMD